MKIIITLILATMFLSPLMAHDTEKKLDYIFINTSFTKPEAINSYIDTFGLQITLGYQFTSNLAITVTAFGEIQSDRDLSGASFSSDTDNPNSIISLLENSKIEKTTAFFVNLEINNLIPIISFDLYAGVGIGRQSIVVEEPNGGKSITNVVEEDTPVYQIYAGLRFFLTYNFAVFAELRHIIRQEDFKGTETITEDIASDISSAALGVYLKF